MAIQNVRTDAYEKCSQATNRQDIPRCFLPYRLNIYPVIIVSEYSYRNYAS